MIPRSHRAARRSDCDRRIHAAVHALLAERGMRLSMDAVAERAGCSKQTLYSYYGCKENLLRDVLQDHVRLAAGPLGTVSGDLHADLLAFALAHLDRLNNPDVLQTCRLVEAQSHRFPDQSQQIFHDGVVGMQQRLAHRFEQAIDAGQLRHDDPHFMAELLLSMIVGLDFDRQRFQVPHRAGLPARQRWAQFAVDTFLRAFAPAPAAPTPPPPSLLTSRP
ncbi:TetR family transcriptional regulator [Xanthomonas citri pv. citri]|uniref:Transcriptional regulator tetR/acrR family n=8 Tax=Xanthomonas TaxID=338 RepID=A0AAI7ZG12_XANAC|nr:MULTISPECIES: TetR/AcrR family transcriptional regulator [Xanthomonas]OOW50057.1 TetR family transcriptional regulator [Xanthomonas campestris pv. centellae]OOW63640.1 TetR family transcriptional regulator [Xanthomonas campestris pv. thespesiae]OOW77633.1 TetR family transcriptional regulator [Xanthomonas campestris pv. leeana]OOW83472.1 TetR family transcriptional regulator [Xanthomonas campestris pv. vitiswoodrowii]OOW87413.1 TetR family transcriptional regulator [Xanthomonas campestris p